MGKFAIKHLTTFHRIKLLKWCIKTYVLTIAGVLPLLSIAQTVLDFQNFTRKDGLSIDYVLTRDERLQVVTEVIQDLKLSNGFEKQNFSFIKFG